MTTDEAAAMYAVANDHEADVLDQLRRRAGLTWDCHNRPGGFTCWTNGAEDETCENCGARRHFECHECGEEFIVTPHGTTHHVSGDSLDGIDFHADRDHRATASAAD